MTYSYAEVETNTLSACEAKRGARFNSDQRQKMRRAHAYALRAIRRYSRDGSISDNDVPAVKKQVYKSMAGALGIWEVLLPILVPFLKQAVSLLVEQLIKWIDGLNPDTPQANKATFKLSTLDTLAAEGERIWK